MQKTSVMTIVVLLLSVGLLGTASAQLTGHYPLGAEGIRAASVPPPGLYLKNYFFYYESDVYRDGQGGNNGMGLDLDAFVFCPRLIWMTGDTVLGADFGMDVLLPLNYTDLEMDTVNFRTHDLSIGDMCIEPILLGWHCDNYDIGAGLAFWIPTGDREADNPATPGKDFYTTMFTLGGTYYFDAERTLSASILGRYELHGDMRHDDIRPGDNLLFEWGVAKTIMPCVDLGVVGYNQWQLTDDTGDDVTWNDVHDRVGAIGPEVQVFFPEYTTFVSFRWEWEYSAVDRPEGSTAVLTITKIF
ncbi:MAG: transporter [Sedimentisphaerales bacterium]|nr:transporter [Sedimentisphaerales bacterium]